jgi:hypothetical protein
MFKKYLLATAVALMMVPTYFVERADAVPVVPHALAGVARVSDAQPVYYRRYYGGRGYYGGRWRVGGRYYGGVWYGTGRRWYGGRWWAYGVGSCWRTSPIGYVWVCG